MFMPCLHRLHRYRGWLVHTHTPHSYHCDRGQRVLRVRVMSCCCNPADTPAGRQTDRPADKHTGGLGVFIASLHMHLTASRVASYALEAKPLRKHVVFYYAASTFHKYECLPFGSCTHTCRISSGESFSLASGKVFDCSSPRVNEHVVLHNNN